MTLPGPWDATFSLAAARFAADLAAKVADDAAFSTRREVLSFAAAHVDPETPGLEAVWPEDVADERVRAAFEVPRETIRFRAAMRAHLRAETSR